MSISETQLQEWLDALESAYYRGALSVSMNGQSVSFASGEEMRRRIAELKQRLGQSKHVNATQARFNRNR